jgi:hypothetical protein
VTAPPDLWLVRQVLGTYAGLGVTKRLARGERVAPARLAADLGLNPTYLAWDLDLLEARGYVARRGASLALGASPTALEAVRHATPLDPAHAGDLATPLAELLAAKSTAASRRALAASLALPERRPKARDWLATSYQLELGHRVVPFVLALRKLELTRALVADVAVKAVVPGATPAVLALLAAAGYATDAGRVTAFGARVFARGPGPFGIIHAYHAYLKEHLSLLRGEPVGPWVARGANVAASQDANRKTFELANDSLDRFCADTGFRFGVFIEHAVGQGEASRQRFARSGDAAVRYFGADLEAAAIERARAAQANGLLPRGMQFVSGADIGEPSLVTDAVRAAGAATEGAVMMVGNGFHEVRGQTNERMTAVFRGYAEAGIVLVFTEESALSTADLVRTGWNTYHSGFRYVHEISGQGLRPASDVDDGPRWSWARCATAAGYRVLARYTTRTRTIYPHPRPDGFNPSISVNYFCVPSALAARLGVDAA